MRLKQLTCSACQLPLGGYNRQTGTLVLDVKSHPAIAFFVDATDSSTDLSVAPSSQVSSSGTPAAASRYSVKISCPSCGCRTSFDAVSIRFGTTVKKSNNAPTARPSR